jgi:hypothetical protein
MQLAALPADQCLTVSGADHIFSWSTVRRSERWLGYCDAAFGEHRMVRRANRLFV